MLDVCAGRHTECLKYRDYIFVEIWLICAIHMGEDKVAVWSWFLGTCFPFHRIPSVFFSIWSCAKFNPRENVFQSILTTKKQRNCRYLHAFLGHLFRANPGTCCMSGCWCWCCCCQECLYILTRFKHSMPRYVGTIARWSQFILVWILTDMDQSKTPVEIFHSSVKSQYYLQYWKSYQHIQFRLTP